MQQEKEIYTTSASDSNTNQLRQSKRDCVRAGAHDQEEREKNEWELFTTHKVKNDNHQKLPLGSSAIKTAIKVCVYLSLFFLASLFSISISRCGRAAATVNERVFHHQNIPENDLLLFRSFVVVSFSYFLLFLIWSCVVVTTTIS